jgi:TMEM175 potassium channel family protein
VDRDEQRRSIDSFDVAGEVAEERAGELNRLISLSDGVFAFAMTLLIVSIEVPDLTHDEASTRLVQDIRDLWPQVLSYIIGFLVIAFLWSSHRRVFSRVREYDDRLVKLNVVLLMLVAFLPFPTGILGQYGELSFPTIFYAAIIAAISVIFILIIDHLDQHRELLTREGAGFDFPRAKTRHLVTASIFLLSMPIAWFFPGVGQIAWFLLMLNHWITERVIGVLPGRFHERPQS